MCARVRAVRARNYCSLRRASFVESLDTYLSSAQKQIKNNAWRIKKTIRRSDERVYHTFYTLDLQTPATLCLGNKKSICTQLNLNKCLPSEDKLLHKKKYHTRIILAHVRRNTLQVARSRVEISSSSGLCLAFDLSLNCPHEEEPIRVDLVLACAFVSYSLFLHTHTAKCISISEQRPRDEDRATKLQ